jgi:L-fucose mutarotase/ribose pyranase (RbsD/FucU family)
MTPPFLSRTSRQGVTGLNVLKRIHRRLFRLNDRIDSLNRELRLVNAELSDHRSIDEDAQRDAVVGNYIDREEAGRTAGDVRRFERTAFYLRVRRAKLIKTRDRLLSRLPD